MAPVSGGEWPPTGARSGRLGCWGVAERREGGRALENQAMGDAKRIHLQLSFHIASHLDMYVPSTVPDVSGANCGCS
jgi:hypothetical protein